MNFSKFALGMSLGKNNEKLLKGFQCYQAIIDSEIGFFDTSILSTGKVGKPKGHKSEKIKERDNLKEKGLGVTEISLIEFHQEFPKGKSMFTFEDRAKREAKKEAVKKYSYRNKKKKIWWTNNKINICHLCTDKNFCSNCFKRREP